MFAGSVESYSTVATIYTDDFNFGVETAELVHLDVRGTADPLAEMPT